MLSTLPDLEDVLVSPTIHQDNGMVPVPKINACLIARIGWCHGQAMHALTAAEAKHWWAETQGLIDALLHRNSTPQYERLPGLRERYITGLEDGEAIIQTAKVRPFCHHRYRPA